MSETWEGEERMGERMTSLPSSWNISNPGKLHSKGIHSNERTWLLFCFNESSMKVLMRKYCQPWEQHIIKLEACC